MKQSGSIRDLLSSDYFPFGSQYYRAPSPASDQWEKDLAQCAKLGFNTVKFWVQWRWNHPAPGTFMFDDIDTLMDLAHAHGLRVMLNTIVDVAPAWIYTMYPDASMVTLDGRRIGPQTQPHRQIGGLGVCLNHPEAMEHLFTFLRTTVRRYTDHPALEMWNVGSEPELTQSMAEMRLYARNADNMRDMLCYCEYCRKGFRAWLRERYARIEDLNASWNRNYSSFDQAEVPLTRNTFNDMIDWRMFFVHTLGEHVQRRFEVAREVDGGSHPLLCHHVFIQGFPVTSTANDPWNVGRFGDLHGFTQMDDPMMSDILRSCAKGKPVISAEMLMLMGYTIDLPQPIGMNDIKRYIFTGIAANLKGFIFWQYRPETLGREAPAWGLTYLDGSQTPWLGDYAKVGRVLQQHKDILLRAAPRRADVALLYSPENQVFVWEATGDEMSATDSLLGTHRALYENNFTVDFLHPKEVESGVLDSYDCLYLPFAYCLDAAVTEKLKQWVHDGGTLIGESYTAGWDRQRGAHATTLPGGGLHSVFQAQFMSALPIPADDTADIILRRKLGKLTKGKRAAGVLVQDRMKLHGASILAQFSDGSPAVTMASFGKGKAILIGSYLGLSYQRNRRSETGTLIAELAGLGARNERPSSGSRNVRLDVLKDQGDAGIVIVQNLESKAVRTTITIPGLRSRSFKEVFTGRTLRCARRGTGVSAVIPLQKKEVKVFRV